MKLSSIYPCYQPPDSIHKTGLDTTQLGVDIVKLFRPNAERENLQYGGQPALLSEQKPRQIFSRLTRSIVISQCGGQSTIQMSPPSPFELAAHVRVGKMLFNHRDLALQHV